MNYAGKFGSGDLGPFSGADIGLGASLSPHGHFSSSGKVQVDKVSTHAPSDAIIISDAHLLFSGDFKRSGVDLILSSGDRELVLPDYFKGEKRAALASPDGAHLTGDIVNALAGHTQFAQADGSASVAPQMIGHVTKLVGNATAIRNGVSIILNQGDTVHKGDVVQSGSDSTLGITFIDGTVFGLASNARMVLNEMVYDPNGSDNKSLLSLVQGTISFVAGATAKKGDMKVDTPVATMGIRGTAVLVEIDFEVPGSGVAPPAKFQVLVEPDGTTGSYILFDKTTLTPIATVNRAGTQTIINGQGGVSFQSSVQLSPDAQKIISDVFSLKFTDLNNPNTKLTTNFTDSIIPETLLLKLASNSTVPVTLQFINVPERIVAERDPAPVEKPPRIAGPPLAAAFGGEMTELADVTGNASINTTSGVVNYADINPDDRPSVSTQFSSFTYQNAQGVDVSATLTAQQLAAIQAVKVPLVVTQDPNGKNYGTATWTYNVADGAFDFLAAGETLKLTYLARVDTNYAPANETTFVPFTIVVTGTNDKPTISATGGEITERIGTGNTTIDVVSGTVTFGDVDLTDRPVVSVEISTTDPFRYYDAEGNDVTATLTPEQLAAIQAVEVPLSVVQGGGNTNNGSASWTYSIEDSKFDFLAKGETLVLNYVAKVDDGHGGVITTSITVSIDGADVAVSGTNDLPTIEVTCAAFPELSNPGQPNPTGSTVLHTVSGTIGFTDVDLTDRPVASAQFTSFSYANAAHIDITPSLTAAQLAAIANVDVPLMVVQASGNANNGSASWSYSVADGAFDFLADGEILNLTYTATVDDGHGGVVSKPFTVTVTGSNDTAEITSDPQAATIAEKADTHNSTTPDTASGAITFTDTDLTDTHAVTITGVGASGVMTGLANGTVQLSWLSLGALADSTDGVQGSKTWSFSAPDHYFDYLADGEAVTLTYTVQVDDHHGGVAWQDVVVTINGSNDAPEIAGIAQQGLTEPTGTAALTTTIPVTFTDLDLSDVGHTATITDAVATGTTSGLALDETALIALVTPGVVTKAAGSSAGSVGLSFSAASTAFDYLAKDEVLTLTYTVAIDDGEGGTTKTFVVTVTGTDDAPVIANIAQKDLTEPTDTSALTATIPVTFSDVDLSDIGHTAAITSVMTSGKTAGLALDNAALIALVEPGTVTKDAGLSSGSVNLSFSAASTAFNYLAAGEQLTLTYTVSIDDGDGGVTPKTFVVTITGTNDAPVIADIAQNHLTEQTGSSPLTATIPVTFTDVDLADTDHTADITGVVASGTTTGLALDNAALIALVEPGAVTKNSGSSSGSVNLSFSAASTAFNYLAAGEQLTLTYTVAIDDGDGGTASKAFTITVTGTNDAPVFTGTDLAPTYQAGDAAVALAGSVSASDVDSSNYAGGSFTAAVTDGGHQGDTLTIANGDLISVSGTDILYDADGAAGPAHAQVVGTISDYDTNSLQVTLNGNASDAAVAALAQAIEFSNATPDPVAGERTVTFTLQDSGGTANGGQDSAYFTAKVEVEAAANQAPVLSAESVSVVENGDDAVTTTVFDIKLSDDDQASDVTITASALHGTLSSVEAGNVSEINAQFADGIIYTPTDYNGDTELNDIVTVTATDANGHSDTLNFVFQQSGWNGATLEGTDEKDVIFATEGNDTLTGYAKADQFVFAPEDQYDPSADEITDFKPGEDHIDLRAFSEVDSSSIETWLGAHATASPTDDADTLITLEHGETITLKGVAVASLHASDFIVSPHH
ncbi:hypothetical protein ACH79_14630 [Bradyrhizobium sp. CCBAU 051011]|uniref:VCBS domain-containing protein n=1 Tax=Bradyrhizobium sp. CCBAU 051011 TaxID=858422 RepID=UPI001373E7B9|nr:VCBS domain-containing protein [Bradyrhizobium sp. CCBAU 051011]QHO73702.1 hypothetical protein ACH79_14630 [Bradyrhizobium sp. CCBAU 051011]